MKKFLYFLIAFLGLSSFAFAVDANDLLPPEQAFVPQVNVTDQGISVQFKIADGYYMYQSKIVAATNPDKVLAEPKFSKGEEKEDEFFGKQTVYHHTAQVDLPYKQAAPQYKLTLTYQGCAEVGVCYPPVDTEFDVKGNGVYQPQSDEPVSAKDRFLQPSASSDGQMPAQPTTNNPDSSRFKLSWDTLNANLLAFFVAGLGLSFTACMYPLLPIVSSIVVGDKKAGKGRAFTLSMVYVQGLALTYTLVGVIAGLTGALLTVWLQQPWVVLAAAALMVILALSMFGLFNIQLPNSVQSYFQNQSNKLSGGKIISVFIMGILSALIVGPCVAPPLAFALGYIGQTGDAVLGGLALYALALGTGVPL
ncbi:MAG: protein-disulfide reductase DsbD, partial [Neisseria subflava]|nr:protein-disulfide reductase DsbD [Neisseria subflava]